MPLEVRPLRVIVVAPGTMVGGQANAARQIVAGFKSDSRIKATFLPIDPRLSGLLAPLTELKGLRSITRPILLFASLIRHCRNADVIHAFAAAHSAFFFGAVPALVAGALSGRPVILNYHDGRAEDHIRRSPRLLRWAIRRAAVMVVPSAFLAGVFERAGYRAQIVPNVVDTRHFAFRVPRPLRLRLISLRLLEPLYAVENTLRAFAIARQELPELTLDIYGDGESRAELEAEARSMTLQGVTFHGAIPHGDVPRVLAEGGVLVNSSRVDNMPLFVIEGFASGTPIVSTSAGGIPFMITDEQTGLLVPLDRPEALASAAIRIFRDPALAERLAVAARGECERYTWAAARDAWVSVYEQAMGTNPAQGAAA